MLCEDTDVIRLLRWTYDLITGNPWLFWAAMATNAVGVVWGGLSGASGKKHVHSLGFDKLSLRHPYPELVEGSRTETS
jgi:hypothetical protein